MNVEHLRKEAERMMGGLHRPERSPWEKHRLSLIDHIIKGDDPLNFTRWSTIQATMFVGDVPFVRSEYKEIMADKDLQRWAVAMEDSHFGGPPRFDPDPRFTPSSIHNAYHLRVWEQITGKNIASINNITEFGGGYGQMCAVIHRLGFTGSYTLFDLPEFLLLQRFYLENVLPQDVIERLDFLEVDSDDRFQLPPEETDLLIGCYSLCEASIHLQDAFFDIVFPSGCLIASHDAWGSIDLNQYYDRFMRSRNNGYIWHRRENKYIQGHFYIIGERKSEQRFL